MWNKRCSSRTSASHNRSEAATQPGTQLRLVLCLFLILPVCVPVHHPLWCSTDRRCVLILPLCRPDVLGEWGVILLGLFFIIFAHILQVYSTFIVHLLLFIIIYYHSHSSFLVIFPGIWCLRRTLCLDAGSEVKGTSCFIISYWTSQKKHFSRVYMFFSRLILYETAQWNVERRLCLSRTVQRLTEWNQLRNHFVVFSGAESARQ